MAFLAADDFAYYNNPDAPPIWDWVQERTAWAEQHHPGVEYGVWDPGDAGEGLSFVPVDTDSAGWHEDSWSTWAPGEVGPPEGWS